MSRQLTVSMSILRDLMFGFDVVADIRAQSLIRPDPYAPIVVPKAVGKLLDDLNTDGLFHIIHFDAHSEVWHKNHWMDSNSRRWELIAKSSKASDAYNARCAEQNARQQKLAAIKSLIIHMWSALEAAPLEEELHKLAVTLSKFQRQQCNTIPGLEKILYGQSDSTSG